MNVDYDVFETYNLQFAPQILQLRTVALLCMLIYLIKNKSDRIFKTLLVQIWRWCHLFIFFFQLPRFSLDLEQNKTSIYPYSCSPENQKTRKSRLRSTKLFSF